MKAPTNDPLVGQGGQQFGHAEFGEIREVGRAIENPKGHAMRMAKVMSWDQGSRSGAF
jgi:hypothetical protein